MSGMDHQSPMHDVQAAMGATFVSFWGFVWTESFGDLLGEYWGLRKGAGVADVNIAKFEWSGPDAAVAAQRLIANDVLGLDVGQVRYGPLLDVNGKMIDDGMVFRVGEERFWIMPNRWHDLEDHFSVITSGLDVTITDITVDTAVAQIQGPKSREALAKLTDVDLSALKYFRFLPDRVEVAGLPVLISRTGFTGELGYELFVSPVDAPQLWEALVEVGASPYGTAVANIQRIESGIVVYGDEYNSGELTPYDVGWDRLVRLDREFFGRDALVGLADDPPRRLRTLRVEGDRPPEPGNRVVKDDRIVGTVTSPSTSPMFGVIALAILDTGASGIGESLGIITDDEVLAAVVDTAPIYDPDRLLPRS